MRRVLVVDDSAFMRRMASQIIDASGDFVVAGTARNGYDALKQVHSLEPDIVTLDVDMPELDGLGALGYIMSEMPRPVVMLSAGTTASGQTATLRALELGAVDFVLKPSGSISLDLPVIADRLLGALRAAAAANPAGLRMLARPVPSDGTERLAIASTATHAVVIASSTGGPRALAAIVPRLSRTLPAAVLVVQHMPAGFTKSLAQRLDAVSPIRVDEAQDGESVMHGRVYVAPGGSHMTVRDDGAGPVIALAQTPPVWGVRPAADSAVSFRRGCLRCVDRGCGADGNGARRCGRNARRSRGGRSRGDSRSRYVDDLRHARRGARASRCGPRRGARRYQ